MPGAGPQTDLNRVPSSQRRQLALSRAELNPPSLSTGSTRTNKPRPPHRKIKGKWMLGRVHLLITRPGVASPTSTKPSPLKGTQSVRGGDVGSHWADTLSAPHPSALLSPWGAGMRGAGGAGAAGAVDPSSWALPRPACRHSLLLFHWKVARTTELSGRETVAKARSSK